MMNNIFVIIGLVLSTNFVCGQDRISGGIPIAKGQFPFYVQFIKDSKFLCGGTLVDSKWILTAAHCFHNTSSSGALDLIDYGEVSAVMGTVRKVTYLTKGRCVLRNIENIVTHPYFYMETVPGTDNKVKTIENDIALVEVKDAFPLNEEVQKIILPQGKDMSLICKEGAIIGSGIAGSDSELSVNIMFAEVHSKTMKDVESYLKTKYTRATVFYSLIEWYKRNAWQDDSGGPFICYDSYTPIQLGVISSKIPIKDNIVLMEYESLTKHMWFINTFVPSLQTKKRFRRSGRKNETDAANPSSSSEDEGGDDTTPNTQHFLFSVRVKPFFVLYFTFLFYLLCK